MVTSVSCFCRPPALYECLGRGGSPCAGVTVARRVWQQHSTHSTARAAQAHGEGARPRLGGRLGGAGLTYTEGKGCVSPTRASSLFGDRVMGRGGRERGREGKEGDQHSLPLVSLWLCCLLRPGASLCHSSSVSICQLSATLRSQRSPGKHRPCRGSHPRPSLARRSPRWGWTR